MNSIDKSRKIISRKIKMGNTEYYVPYHYSTSEIVRTVQTSKPQKHVMKIMVIDNKTYYVPSSWKDCEHTRNIIKKSIKRFPYPLSFS
jgi:hypothetical protein